MNDNEIKRLKFRRQYLFGSYNMKCPFVHNTYKLNDKYVLYTHVDLIYTVHTKGDKKLMLLGDIYDYESVDKKNIDILKDLAEYGFDSILEETSKYAGRFVMIYCNSNVIKFFHDASACRKVYYAHDNGIVACASNQHLLAEVLDYNKTTSSSLLDYYQSKKFIDNMKSDIGYYTYYDEIKQLLPNHYLNVDPFEIKRFWPDREPESYSNEDSVALSAKMIIGFITAAARRYELMIPITSGYDSRAILAATKDISDRIYYYLNCSEEIMNSSDYYIPRNFFTKFNIKFNLLNIDSHVDEKFREIYLLNNPLADEKFLPIIYNYYKHHSEKLNLPGNVIPIVKALHHFSGSDISSESLAKSYGNGKFEIVNAFIKDWLSQTRDVAKKYGVSVFDLLFWEDFTCNQRLQIQLDKDIAQEEFIPFNSRNLILIMLAYEKAERQKPYLKFHKDIIRKLWPELLNYPFNPSFKQKIKQILISFKLYHPIVLIKKKFSGEI